MAENKKIPVGGQLDPMTPEKVLAEASNILDQSTGERQSDINIRSIESIHNNEYYKLRTDYQLYDKKNISSLSVIKWEQGYQWIADEKNDFYGTKSPSTTGRKASNLIPIDSEVAYVEATLISGAKNTTGGIVLLDEKLNPIKGYFNNEGLPMNPIIKIYIPDNAKYLAVTYSDEDEAKQKFVLLLYNNKTSHLILDDTFLFGKYFKYIKWGKGYQWVADKNNSGYGKKVKSTTGHIASNILTIPSDIKAIETTLLSGPSDAAAGLIFFDSELNPVKGYFNNEGLPINPIIKIDIPDNAKYLATTYRETAKNPFVLSTSDAFIFEQKDKILKAESRLDNAENRLGNAENRLGDAENRLDNAENRLDNAGNDIEYFKKSFKGEIINLAKDIVWEQGQQWIADKSNANFGNKYPSTTGRKASNLIPLDGDETLEVTLISGSQETTGGVLLLDSNQKPIKGYFNNEELPTNPIIKIVVPENAKYLAVTYSDKDEARQEFILNITSNRIKDIQKHINEIEEEIRDVDSNISGEIINIVKYIKWKQGYQWIADKDSSAFGKTYPSTTGRKASNLIPMTSKYTIDISLISGPSEAVGGLVFFDKDKNPISGIIDDRKDKGYVKLKDILPPDGTAYIAVTAWMSSDKGKFELYKKFRIKSSFASNFKPYTPEYERFKVMVNQTPIPAWKSQEETTATATLDDVKDLQPCTGVIALPKTYTPDGEPTKLIMFGHGGHGYVDETHWYPTYKHFPATVQDMLDHGYAVFDCNGYKDTPYDEWISWQNDNRNNVQISEGLPQVIEAYWKCYLYIIANYNVYPNIYLWGCSQGGHLVMNFAYTHRQVVACIAMCAGQIDLFNQGYLMQTLFNRKQVAKLLGFEIQDGSYEAYEHYKADQFDPMKRIVTIGDKDYVLGWNTPIKFFYGTKDTCLPQFEYTKKMVTALKNSKVICQLRWFEGMDHDDVSSGKNDIAREEIYNWFERF